MKPRTVSEQREQALGESLRHVASELRLIDAADFISYIRLEKYGHLEHLVNAAAELYFRPGSLCFGASADLDVDWGKPPAVLIDMEFKWAHVKINFSMMIEAARAGVEINQIWFDGEPGQPSENTQRLIAALTDARAGLDWTLPGAHTAPLSRGAPT
jgi:hypothetical protein